MAYQRDKWFAAAVAALIVAAQPACNRGDDKSAAPKVIELPVPVAATSTVQAQPTEVKRYGAQEQPLNGSVRVTADSVKAYFEADNKGEPRAELAKSTVVTRKASFGDYSLVEYPTPKGDTDLGWVLTGDLAGSQGSVTDTTAKKVAQPSTDAGTTGTTENKAEGKTAQESGKTASSDTKETDTAEEATAKTDETAKTTDEAKAAADGAKKATDAAAKAVSETPAKVKSTKSSKLPTKKP
jgi:hypothetical protein